MFAGRSSALALRAAGGSSGVRHLAVANTALSPSELAETVTSWAPVSGT